MSCPTHASFSLHTAYAPGVVPGVCVELDASEAAHLRAVRALPGLLAQGGWEPEDDAEAREAGFVEAGLAPRVLRFETAAIAALAVLAQAAEMPVNGDAESDRRLGGR